ncbi:MAG: iron ABC transporter permease [Bacteroidetes bacterium]|nr:MAG: iron ABC transporter permease [Bacteroidota bacterium]MBL1145421.1 iron ABC transporter permease [Bacteroidota bacterium]NOG58219.1 iron ABC transporter permease [Bacteroidota bacterium]
MGGRKKNSILFLILILSVPTLFALDILFGTVSIPFVDFKSAFTGGELSRGTEIIIFQSRIPKAFTAIICGAALSLSGLLMQTLFRNPLAGPYILGVSSGAGLGVAIFVMGAGAIGFSLTNSITLTLASMLGSLGILLILFLVSTKVKDVMTLLILGVMIGSIATALIGIIQYFTSDAQLKSFLIWTLGSLEGVSFDHLKLMMLILLPSSIVAFGISKNLNAILLGDNYAKSLGISLKTSRLLIIILTGVLAGMVTAFCGPIGFVGIIVPHICRLLFQTAEHKILIPGSLLLGASMMLLSDLLAHLPGDGFSLPINSITSIIGIPIIIWIIFNKRSISNSF